MTDTKKKPTKTTPSKKALNDGSISLTLKIKKEDIKATYGKILIESAKNVELKGFRKGKAPLDLVEASLDKSKLYSRVLELVIPPVYSQAIRDGKYMPLIEPKITPIKMEEDKDWEFLAETAQAPEVRVGDYKKYFKASLAKAKKAHEAKAKTDNKDDQPKENEENWKLQAVLDAILDNAEVTPSPILVSEEAHAQIHRLESQLSQIKLTLDDYLKSIKKTHEELDAEYHQTATDNIRLEFSLKSIVDEVSPEVSEKELETLKPAPGQRPYAKYLLQKQKVLDTLVEL